MIVTTDEAKAWLKIDDIENDETVQLLCTAAETYLNNATGAVFDNTNALAKLYCCVLISDWYENRNLMQDQKVSNNVRFTLQSILLQLQLNSMEVVI